jgi:hypothetical protein
MKKHVIGLLLLLILIVCIPSALPAEESLERLVPEGSLGVVSFQGLKQSIEKFKGTALVKIFQSTESSESTTKLWNQMIKGYEELRSKFATEMGFELAELLDIFGKQITVAVVDIKPEELSKKNSKEAPEVLILANVNGYENRLKELLDMKILPKIKKENPKTKVSIETYKTTPITTFTDKDSIPVSYAFLNTTFVMSWNPTLMKKTIDSQGQNGDEKNITNNASYKSIVETIVRDKSEVSAYVDMKKILEMTKKQMKTSAKPSDQQALKFLDYYNLNSMSWSLSIEGEGLKERLFLQTYPSEKGFWTQLMKGVEGSMVTSDTMIPADVLYYQSSLINLVQVWRYLMTTLKEAMPPQEYQKVEIGLTFIRDGLKLDPEKNFFEHLGEEMAMALNIKGLSELTAGGKVSVDNFPFLFMIKAKNQSGLQQTLTQLAALLQMQFQQDTIENTVVQYLEVPGADFPIQFNHAFMNDFWVLSLSQSMIGESIRASSQKNALIDNSDYKALKTHFSDENVTGRGYLNIKGALKLLAPLVNKGMTSLSQQMRETAPGLDLIKSSDLAKIADSLFGMMWVSRTREDGFLTESYSPVGSIMGLAVAAGLIAGISNPANLNTMGDQDSQSKTMADMRILATAIEAYIAANGSAPKDLEGLTLEYLQEVPLKDAWGHDFIYETGEDSQSYTLLSLGEDGVEGGKDSKMDLVVEDGEFIAGPDIQR